MKEQIKNLTIQARKHADSLLGKGLPDMVWQDEYNKKLVELIVKECANLLVKEAKSSHDEGSETYDTLIRESNWMKRYFGVTE